MATFLFLTMNINHLPLNSLYCICSKVSRFFDQRNIWKYLRITYGSIACWSFSATKRTFGSRNNGLKSLQKVGHKIWLLCQFQIPKEWIVSSRKATSKIRAQVRRRRLKKNREKQKRGMSIHLLIWIGPSGEFHTNAGRRTTEHGRTDGLRVPSTFLRTERCSLLLSFVSALFRFLLFLRESSRCGSVEESEVFSSTSSLHGSTFIWLLRTIFAR